MQQGNRLRWLGSGLYLCGRCGTPMRVTALGSTPSRENQARTYHYRCTASAHLTVLQTKTDAHVRSAVAGLVRDLASSRRCTLRDDDRLSVDRGRRAVLTARLAAFERDYASGAITGSQLKKATDTVAGELAEVDARLVDALRQSTSSPIVSAVDPGQAFLDAPVDVQRVVLAAVLTVEVLPTPHRGSVWAEQRLRFTPIA